MTMRVKPKKALGQHFLTDLHIARRIAETVDVEPYMSLPVVEIGPGMGVLTQFLLEQDRPLKAVEIDSESVEYLHRVYPELDVMEGDFLRMDADSLFPGEFALIGNYPYNISSQIFFRVLGAEGPHTGGERYASARGGAAHLRPGGEQDARHPVGAAAGVV